MQAKRFGQIGPVLLLFAVLTAGSASAYDPYDPHNCSGFDCNDKRALVVQKVTAKPRVNFIKSPYNDQGRDLPGGHRGLPEEVRLRHRRPRAHRQDTGRLHLHLLPIESADLGHRLAAEHGADAGRANGLTEDFGLARHLAPPWWQRRDQGQPTEGGITGALPNISHLVYRSGRCPCGRTDHPRCEVRLCITAVSS
jgi:hypothetical protein